jgi:hypothetical protein
VDNLVVHADAGHAGKAVGELRRGSSAMSSVGRRSNGIEFCRRHPYANRRTHCGYRECDDLTDTLHSRQIAG